MSQIPPELMSLIFNAGGPPQPEPRVKPVHIVMENEDGSVTMSMDTLLAMTQEIQRLTHEPPLPQCFERILRELASVTLLLVRIFREAEKSPAAAEQCRQIEKRVREIQEHAEQHGFQF